MAINTAERRRSALDFGKGTRGTGMHIPSRSIKVGARAHILNLYGGITPVPTPSYNWRNRNIVSSSWVSKIPPPDSSTQEI
jgi:hypothetical protein